MHNQKIKRGEYAYKYIFIKNNKKTFYFLVAIGRNIKIIYLKIQKIQ